MDGILFARLGGFLRFRAGWLFGLLVFGFACMCLGDGVHIRCLGLMLDGFCVC